MNIATHISTRVFTCIVTCLLSGCMSSSQPYHRSTLRRTIHAPETSQRRLARIAIRTGDQAAARDATNRITDEDLLWNVASRARHNTAIEIAIQRMQDPEAYIRMVMESEDPVFYPAILQRLDDAELIERIYRSTDSFAVKTAAIAASPDIAFVTSIARSDAYGTLRTAAVKRIDDDAVLYDIAIRDPHSIVRFTAAERIQSADARAQLDRHLIVMHLHPDAPLPDAELDAMWEPVSSEQIEVIAQSDRDVMAQLAAVRRISDTALLAKLAEHDPYWAVRQAAEERLTEVEQQNLKASSADGDTGGERRTDP